MSLTALPFLLACWTLWDREYRTDSMQWQKRSVGLLWLKFVTNVALPGLGWLGWGTQKGQSCCGIIVWETCLSWEMRWWEQKWPRVAPPPCIDVSQWCSGTEGTPALMASPYCIGEKKDEEVRKQPADLTAKICHKVCGNCSASSFLFWEEAT